MTNAISHVAPKAFVVESVKGLLRKPLSDYCSYILLRLRHTHTLLPVRTKRGEEHYVRLSKEHANGVHDGLRYDLVPTLVDAAWCASAPA